MVRICHASISENKTVNGKKGDSTGNEVCTRSWYSKPWDCMLRNPNPDIANKIAEYAVKLANSNLVGYSQAERNTLYKELEKNNYNVDQYIKSGVLTNTDCSAFAVAVSVCAGAPLKYSGNAPTTSTMRNSFYNAGFLVYQDPKYLTTDANLKKGDILVKSGSHTVIVIDDGNDGKKYYPACKSNYTSFTDALRSVGETDVTMSHRILIASANDMKGYQGTAEQNTKLLRLLKEGRLCRV